MSCKTDDGKICYNVFHEAREHAKEKLKYILRHAKVEMRHIYSEECSPEKNELYD